MKQQKQQFTPKRIGQPDERRKAQIIEAYSNLIETMSLLKSDLEYCLKNDDAEISNDEFLEALNQDTVLWIKQKFIEVHKISLPGISNQKLAELDLLDIRLLEDVVERKKLFLSAKEKVDNLTFVYPLRKMLTPDHLEWELTPDFYEAVEKSVSKYTANDVQNFLLEKMEDFVEILNVFHEVGIMKPQHGPNDVTFLANCIEVKRKNQEKPFQVSNRLFSKPRFKVFDEDRKFKKMEKGVPLLPD